MAAKEKINEADLKTEVVPEVVPVVDVKSENVTENDTESTKLEKIKALSSQLEILELRAQILEVKERIAKSQRALGLPKKV